MENVGVGCSFYVMEEEFLYASELHRILEGVLKHASHLH